jgi:hypothetical protein
MGQLKSIFVADPNLVAQEVVAHDDKEEIKEEVKQEIKV